MAESFPGELCGAKLENHCLGLIHLLQQLALVQLVSLWPHFKANMWINFLSYENPVLSALFKKAFSMTLANSFNYLGRSEQ